VAFGLQAGPLSGAVLRTAAGPGRLLEGLLRAVRESVRMDLLCSRLGAQRACGRQRFRMHRGRPLEEHRRHGDSTAIWVALHAPSAQDGGTRVPLARSRRLRPPVVLRSCPVMRSRPPEPGPHHPRRLDVSRHVHFASVRAMSTLWRMDEPAPQVRPADRTNRFAQRLFATLACPLRYRARRVAVIRTERQVACGVVDHIVPGSGPGGYLTRRRDRRGRAPARGTAQARMSWAST